jgi:pimeloyl-ACP methyl ester carboxylesterase
MAMVKVRDALVEYLVDGTGPGLVLVHGTGGSAEANWGQLVGRFSKHWTVVRPNFSGSGKTTDGGGPLSVEMLAEQVLAAARAAGRVPFNLVGFSLGAAVAAVVAASSPECVRSLVIIGGFADSSDPYLKLQFSLWRDLIASDRSALSRLFLLTGFSDDFISSLSELQVEASASSMLGGTDWEGLARQVELDLRVDIREQVQSIACPTLVVGSSKDCIVPVRHARILADSIAGAEYTEFAAGHLAAIEQPNEFAHLVESFLLRER